MSFAVTSVLPVGLYARVGAYPRDRIRLRAQPDGYARFVGRDAQGEQASSAGRSGDQLTETLKRTVDEGVMRVGRSLPALLTTGLVGAGDVALGLFALYIVREATHSEMLGALAFSIGFIALTLASSELFTENFLVPIAAVLAGKASKTGVLRLWIGTLVMNLAGGWVVMGLITTGFPKLGSVTLEVGRFYPAIGTGWRSLAGAIVGGAVITLMTWMERSTESVPGKLAAAISAAFLLAAAPLNHVIVVSLEMFAALQRGAPFGYLDWLSVAGWYTLGNVIGGVGLVTVLRMIQVGERLKSERREGG
jgi:formate/nitrite transporter FocA (FNT family)